jgi:hypothetical protein
MRNVEAFDFARARTVVDVGGGNGSLLSAILSTSPTTTGVFGGRERTRDEYATLLDAAGLRLDRVVDTVSALSIIEAVPTLYES